MAFTSVLNHKLYPLILEGIYVNEDLLIELRIMKNYSKYKIIQALAVVLCLNFLIINILLNVYLIYRLNINPSIYLFIAMYAPAIYAAIVVIFYNTFMVVSGDTFQKLAEEIEEINEKRLFKNSPNLIMVKSLEKEFEDSELLIKISKIWDIYDKVCDLCDLMEKSVNINVLIMMGCSFVSLVFNEFQALVIAIQIMDSEENFFFLLFCLHQIASHTITLFLLIFVNNRTKNMVIIYLLLVKVCVINNIVFVYDR